MDIKKLIEAAENMHLTGRYYDFQVHVYKLLLEAAETISKQEEKILALSQDNTGQEK